MEFQYYVSFKSIQTLIKSMEKYPDILLKPNRLSIVWNKKGVKDQNGNLPLPIQQTIEQFKYFRNNNKSPKLKERIKDKAIDKANRIKSSALLSKQSIDFVTFREKLDKLIGSMVYKEKKNKINYNQEILTKIAYRNKQKKKKQKVINQLPKNNAISYKNNLIYIFMIIVLLILSVIII